MVACTRHHHYLCIGQFAFDRFKIVLPINGGIFISLNDLNREITVNQSSPAALTSEGIFEVTDNTMKYEIVQTSPDISAVPPTAAAGFGSTNGGALGESNVQVYERVE